MATRIRRSASACRPSRWSSWPTTRATALGQCSGSHRTSCNTDKRCPLATCAGSHHDGTGLGFRVSIRGKQNGNPGEKPSNGRIAVKVINHLGDEVMKVFRVNR